MCGVAKGPMSLRAVRNLHLPLAHAPGESGELITWDGFRFAWRDAPPLPIPPIDEGDAATLPPAHYRCANFRFARAWFGSRRVAT